MHHTSTCLIFISPWAADHLQLHSHPGENSKNALNSNPLSFPLLLCRVPLTVWLTGQRFRARPLLTQTAPTFLLFIFFLSGAQDESWIYKMKHVGWTCTKLRRIRHLSQCTGLDNLMWNVPTFLLSPLLAWPCPHRASWVQSQWDEKDDKGPVGLAFPFLIRQNERLTWCQRADHQLQPWSALICSAWAWSSPPTTDLSHMIEATGNGNSQYNFTWHTRGIH